MWEWNVRKCSKVELARVLAREGRSNWGFCGESLSWPIDNYV